MYVDNGKISNRQIFRLYLFDLMGIATLLLPPYLARLCGAGGIYAIILGTGLGLGYLLYLGWVMKQMKMDMIHFLNHEVYPWIGKIICLCITLHCVLTSGFCAYIFANLMQYSLVKECSYTSILLLIVIVAGYAVRGGIEGRARVYEVVFWFILIPYFLMMLVSVREVEPTYLEPLLFYDGSSLWQGAYFVFLLLTPLFFSLFLVGEKEKNYGQNITKIIGKSVVFSGVILLGSYVVLLGNFGVESLKQLRFPVVTLMSTIQFEGNFLRRMDALMLAIWFFTLYALLNLHLHYGVRLLSNLGAGHINRRNSWRVVIAVVVVFFVAYGLHKLQGAAILFLKYYSFVAVPFMVGMPAFLLFFRRKGSCIRNG